MNTVEKKKKILSKQSQETLERILYDEMNKFN